MATKVSAIYKQRKVYRDTYANLPVTGLSIMDLGYATDRKIFYRWSGTAWEHMTIYVGYGLAAAKPAATDLPEGCLYQETDTQKLMEVQIVATVLTWVCIFYSGSGTAAAIPPAAGLPEGAFYYETDTTILKQIQSGAWAEIKPPDLDIKVKRKSADQAVNNSEVLVNCTDLVLAVAANERWSMDVFLRAGSAASGTPQMDVAWTIPAGGAIWGMFLERNANPVVITDATAERQMSVINSPFVFLFRLMYVGGGNAGNVQLQFAQNVATAEDTIIYENSHLKATKVL